MMQQGLWSAVTSSVAFSNAAEASVSPEPCRYRRADTCFSTRSRIQPSAASAKKISATAAAAAARTTGRSSRTNCSTPEWQL